MSFKATLAANALYKMGNVVVLFLTTALLSRAMGASGYGLFSLLILNVSLFNLLTSFGSDSAATYLVAQNEKNANRVAAIVLIVAIAQTLLFLFTDGIWYTTTQRHLFLNGGGGHEQWLAMLLLISISWE